MWIELDCRFRLENRFGYCLTEEYVQIISLPGKLTTLPIATRSLPLLVKLSTCKHFRVACVLEAICRGHSFLISSECWNDNTACDAFGLWAFWVLVKEKWRSNDSKSRFTSLKVDSPALLVFYIKPFPRSAHQRLSGVFLSWQHLHLCYFWSALSTPNALVRLENVLVPYQVCELCHFNFISF